VTCCYMVALFCAPSPLHANNKQSHCSLSTHRSFSEGNWVSISGIRSSLRYSLRGFAGTKLGEERAGNIVRLITNVTACSLVLIDEGDCTVGTDM